MSTRPGRRRLTLDAIFGASAPAEKTLGGPAWLPDGSKLTYLDKFPGTEAAAVWTLDPATGEKSPLFDPALVKEPEDETPVPIHAIRWSMDGRRLLLTADAPARFKGSGRILVFDTEALTLRRLSPPAGEFRHPELSPDGSKLGVVRDEDLWTIDVATGAETRLTHDGCGTVYNGRGGWVYEEELGLAKAWWWSPDGRRIAFCRQDESAVPEYLLPRYEEPHAEPRVTRYPKAGDPNPETRVGIIDLADGRITWVDTSPAGSGDHMIAGVQWSPDGRDLLVQWLPRLQARLVVLAADPATGASRVVLEEADEAWVDSSTTVRFVGETREFLWMSDRSGWTHIYRCSLDGGEPVAVTCGEFDVESISAVRPDQGDVVFVAALPDARCRAVCSAPPAGGPHTVLAGGAGRHGALCASKGGAWVHTWSDLHHPTEWDLRAPGREPLSLVADPLPALRSYALSPDRSDERWELLEITTDEGVSLHARMLKPRNLDPSRPHPAIMHVYGGPGSQVTTDQWGGKGGLWHQMMARKGYVILLVDNRGAGFRGRAFRKSVARKLGQLETADQVGAARWLAAQPGVAPGRIGIWGWSYGGYMACMCVVKGGDAFKAAAAVAPVTDYKLYDTIYTERYLTTPAENPDGYRDGAPVHFAADAKGSLLLMHGTMDDNVHWQNTARMLTAMHDAGKPCELMIYPGKHHGIEGRHLYLYTHMTAFFERTLGRKRP
ncbi:MAG: S9 family peptidase [Armatimonadetes bacterium]|nr:S9 family peptidase [Armatimonadota bacterium]